MQQIKLLAPEMYITEFLNLWSSDC
jgi:hypothetical protein